MGYSIYRASVGIMILLLVICLPGGVRAGMQADTEGIDATAQETRADTLTICHVLSGDSGPREQRRIAREDWTKHQEHSDTRGDCKGFRRIKNYPSGLGLQDFRTVSGPSLKFLTTSEELRVYDGDTIASTVPSDSESNVLLSKNESLFASKCQDLSSDFDSGGERGLRCNLIDTSANITDTAFFHNHSKGLVLLGNRMVITVKGKIGLYDFSADTFIWSLDDRIREYYPSSDYRYFLSSYEEDRRTVHELRRLQSASKISRKTTNAFHREVGEDGTYFYLVSSDPTDRKKTLTVFGRDFEKLAQWSGLPFHGKYSGSFSTERREVYVPLENGKLLVGDLKADTRTLVSYPGAFTPSFVRLDSERGLLFLYGSAAADAMGFIIEGIDRRLLVYDINREEFRADQIYFSADEYDFDYRTGRVQLRKLPGPTLAVQHPSRLEIYRYEFTN